MYMWFLFFFYFCFFSFFYEWTTFLYVHPDVSMWLAEVPSLERVPTDDPPPWAIATLDHLLYKRWRAHHPFAKSEAKTLNATNRIILKSHWTGSITKRNLGFSFLESKHTLYWEMKYQNMNSCTWVCCWLLSDVISQVNTGTESLEFNI